MIGKIFKKCKKLVKNWMMRVRMMLYQIKSKILRFLNFFINKIDIFIRIFRSLFLYLKHSQYLKSIFIIPVFIIFLIIGPIWYFKFAKYSFISSFLTNLTTEIIGIVIAVSIISYIQKKESDKKYMQDQLEFLKKTAAVIEKWFDFLFSSFSKLDEGVLCRVYDEAFDSEIMNYHSMFRCIDRFLANKGLIIGTVDKIDFTKIDDKNDLKIYKKKYDDYVGELKELLKSNIEKIELQLIVKLKSAIDLGGVQISHYKIYGDPKTYHEARHHGAWEDDLALHVKSSVSDAFCILRELVELKREIVLMSKILKCDLVDLGY